MSYENRHYVVFNVSELSKINFDQVLETSASTVRKSNDATKTFVKWDGETPACIASLTSKGAVLNHAEMLALLETAEWKSQNTGMIP